MCMLYYTFKMKCLYLDPLTNTEFPDFDNFALEDLQMAVMI